MRFNRDKRGYENTFVVHADRQRGRGQSKILYWFRTPPGVRVGRAALDEDAIRLLEEHNPEIDFDWTRILKGPAPETVERRPPERRAEARSARPAPPVAETPAALEPERAPENGSQPEGPLEMPLTPAEAKLGAEGLSRLRGRYAEMLARVTERVQDPERQAELKTAVERLNPDAWVTDADVVAGLDAYEATFESIRSVVGHRRRRSRRRQSPASGSPAAAPEEPSEAGDTE